MIEQRPLSVGVGASPAAPPRLAIAHLFLWTACCAAVVGLARGRAVQSPGVLGAARLIAVALGYGTAWTGLLVTLTRLLRGARWPLEPGQWLLTIEGAVISMLVAEEFDRTHLFRSPQAVIDAVSACLFVLPLFSRKLAAHWKWMFALLAIAHVWPLAVAMLSAWGQPPRGLGWLAEQLSVNRTWALAAIAAIALTLVDRLSGRRWGWLHWLGVVTAVWLALLPVVAAWSLAPWLLALSP